MRIGESGAISIGRDFWSRVGGFFQGVSEGTAEDRPPWFFALGTYRKTLESGEFEKKLGFCGGLIEFRLHESNLKSVFWAITLRQFSD